MGRLRRWHSLTLFFLHTSLPQTLKDNAAQVFRDHAKPGDVATGFVDGDGTVTLVDNAIHPARLFGTTQFLGVGTIDIDPSIESGRVGDGDGDGDGDEDCGGLCFVQADASGVDQYIGVPLSDYFPDPAAFPYFVQPMVGPSSSIASPPPSSSSSSFSSSSAPVSSAVSMHGYRCGNQL